MTGPVLPYAGTSGWSGSDTSKARAERDDRTGVTANRQAQVLRLLRIAAENGVTWREVASAMGLHHGQASGALSGLHKAGVIERLGNARQRCAVYVLPEYVHGRVTKPYKRNGLHTCPNCGWSDASE